LPGSPYRQPGYLGKAAGEWHALQRRLYWALRWTVFAIGNTQRRYTINLAVRWAKEVNGDFAANMLIRKTGENGLSLLTIDRDPKTGRNVMTSDIVLQRRL
jgi:hypothetical protein